MKSRATRYYACDFETTVYEGQVRTDVWAAGCVELNTEYPVIHNNIDTFFGK